MASPVWLTVQRLGLEHGVRREGRRAKAKEVVRCVRGVRENCTRPVRVPVSCPERSYGDHDLAARTATRPDGEHCKATSGSCPPNDRQLPMSSPTRWGTPARQGQCARPLRRSPMSGRSAETQRNTANFCERDCEMIQNDAYSRMVSAIAKGAIAFIGAGSSAQVGFPEIGRAHV